MAQEELERKIDELQGELDVTGGLLDFFIDALVRTGTPDLIGALQLQLTNILKVARSERTRGARSPACLEGFERRFGLFNRRVTNTLKNLNPVDSDDGEEGSR